MRRIYWILIVISGMTRGVFAQDMEESHGKLDGEWRTFYMSTFNQGELKDFHALGTGGHAGFTYTFNSHWKTGIRMYTTLNTNIQDLTVADETTGKASRYELGLFDLQDPGNDFFILPGELFLQYSGGQHVITAGRMKRSTPFLNPQDGRMIPTLVEGLWYAYTQDNLRVQAGILNRIAPRGIRKFYRIGQSIGTYSTGRDIAGTPAQYAGNTRAEFIGIAGINLKITPVTDLAGWNYYVDNVFNATYIRPDFKLSGNNLILSLEWLHQRKIGDGGNPADSLQYFQDHYANMAGLQLAVKTGNSRWVLGYDHITDDGRFLFPREWGREGTFTFQKRERSEGSRDNHAIVLSVNRNFKGQESVLETVISLGHQWKADVTDAARNKYALPGYTHINLDLAWNSERAKGLQPELLLTYKIGKNDFPEEPVYLLNKVNMFQVNMVLNYVF